MRAALVAFALCLALVAADDIICTQGGSCEAHPDWMDRIEARFHHISFFVDDVCATASFYKEMLGYKVQSEINVPAMPPELPCPMHAILMTRGPGDLLDLDQWLCPPGVPLPPAGFVHFVYMVNDIEVFHNHMAWKHVPVSLNMSVMRSPTQTIAIECYADPNGFQFCAAQNTGIE